MSSNSYHAAMFPWFAMGHMIPYIHLAKQLAARGHKVSILVPKKTLVSKVQQRIIDDDEHNDQNLITLHPLTLPHVEGIPPGAETASDIPQSSNPLLAVAMDLMIDQVEALLKAIKPDVVFYDFAHYIPDVAKQLGIKSVCYQVVCPTAIAFSFVPSRSVPKNRKMTEEEAKYPPPGFPSSSSSPGGFVLGGYELLPMGILQAPFGHGDITFFERMKTAMQNCDALAFRTFRELEGKFCDYMGRQFKKPVLLTGSLLLPAADKTTSSSSSELEYLDGWCANKWLDGFEAGSVVFCVFGSEHVFEKDQFRELVLGIEQTGLPFFIAVRPPKGYATVEEAFPDDGFQERMRGRGVVYGGWVQQPLILSHPSVGCFVSHSGFGSVIESLMTDNQLVLVPQMGDQAFVAKLMVEDLKVAVKVDRDDNGWFSKESLCKAIKSVMDKDSQLGIMLKNNRAQLRDVLTKPGFSTAYIDNFVQDLHHLLLH